MKTSDLIKMIEIFDSKVYKEALKKTQEEIDKCGAIYAFPVEALNDVIEKSKLLYSKGYRWAPKTTPSSLKQEMESWQREEGPEVKLHFLISADGELSYGYGPDNADLSPFTRKFVTDTPLEEIPEFIPPFLREE